MRSAQARASIGADPNGTLVRPEGDFFSTSQRAVQALLAVERFPGVVWEPACGNGAISCILEEQPDISRVISTDLYERGYGVSGVDFLGHTNIRSDHVVTNPPFEKDMAEKFAKKALQSVPGKVAIFARLAWLEGIKRYLSLWSRQPPSRVWVFPDRVPLARNGEIEQTGLIAFAWFVWGDRTKGWHADPPAALGWIPGTRHRGNGFLY